MKFTLPTLLFALLPSTLAAPPPYPTTNSTSTNGTITPPPRYYLRTQVKGYVAAPNDKDGLYVSSYHTGAGENDATLESIDVASAGYLNGSNQQFDLGSEFPWGIGMVDYDFYAGMSFFFLLLLLLLLPPHLQFLVDGLFYITLLCFALLCFALRGFRVRVA